MLSWKEKSKSCIQVWKARDVLFEYHRAVGPFCWAVRPVLEICLPYGKLLTGMPILLAVFQNSRWNSNKTSLDQIDWISDSYPHVCNYLFVIININNLDNKRLNNN